MTFKQLKEYIAHWDSFGNMDDAEVLLYVKGLSTSLYTAEDIIGTTNECIIRAFPFERIER